MKSELLKSIMNATKKGLKVSFFRDPLGLVVSITKRTEQGNLGIDNIITIEEIEAGFFDPVENFINENINNF